MNYLIEFTPQQLSIVGEALSNAPYKVVADLLKVIQDQVNKQDQDRAADKQEAA